MPERRFVFDVELKMAFEFGRQLLVYVILMKTVLRSGTAGSVLFEWPPYSFIA